jgi:hypothetical protein
MGKVVVSQFMTVDGVIDAPGGGEAFELGGWAFEFDRGTRETSSSSRSSRRPMRSCWGA